MEKRVYLASLPAAKAAAAPVWISRRHPNGEVCSVALQCHQFLPLQSARSTIKTDAVDRWRAVQTPDQQASCSRLQDSRLLLQAIFVRQGIRRRIACRSISGQYRCLCRADRSSAPGTKVGARLSGAVMRVPSNGGRRPRGVDNRDKWAGISVAR